MDHRMTKVEVYIASSLDGFIALNDDDISWLDPFLVPGEDYGYAEFMKTVGAVVMGARTYEQSLEHPERLLTGMKNYILSKRLMPIPDGIDAEFFHGDLRQLIDKISGETTGTIYVAGGGRVISGFLNARLVDDLIQFVAPVLLKEGKPLYSGLFDEIQLDLREVIEYRSGIVRLHYAPRKEIR
jgi:dihydrofolate reductase